MYTDTHIIYPIGYIYIYKTRFSAVCLFRFSDPRDPRTRNWNSLLRLRAWPLAARQAVWLAMSSIGIGFFIPNIIIGNSMYIIVYYIGKIGKTMGKPWENHGKIAKPGENDVERWLRNVGTMMILVGKMAHGDTF